MASSECELCGKTVENPVKAKIEGTVLEVCNNCRALGQELSTPKQFQVGKSHPHFQLHSSGDLIENYTTIIRNARQQKNLTIEQLALKISEKDFVVRRVEEGKLKPDPELAKKLEKFLGIHLTENESLVSGDFDSLDQNINKTKEPNDKLTLGDFIRIKKKTPS